MSEIEKKAKGQKPTISRLAIISVSIPVLLYAGSYCFILVLQDGSFGNLEANLSLFALASAYLSPVTFILGIVVLIKVKKSKRLLKGYTLSILGMLISVLSFDCAMRGVNSVRPEARIRNCQSNLKEIAKAIRVYMNDNGNNYPTADKWYDLLREHTDVKHKDVGKITVFCCPGKYRGAHYAINPNCTPNSPPNTVLVFETKNGWNQFGGEEMLSLDNHYRQGSNILFNDGHVEFVKPKGIEELKWKVEDNE